MKIHQFLKSAKLSGVITLALLLTVSQLTVLAQAPCGEQDYDCQITEATKTIQANPNSSDGYIKRGDAYYNKGRYDLSIKDYSKVLEIDPKNAEIFSYRADAYNRLKLYDRAISDYTQSIALDPNNAVTYINRGNSYDNSGNYESAMKDYNKAIVIEPNNYSAYYNRGIASFFKGNNQKAIVDFQMALQIKPDYAAAQEYLDKAKAALTDESGNINNKVDNSQTKVIGQAPPNNQSKTQASLASTNWALMSLTKKANRSKNNKIRRICSSAKTAVGQCFITEITGRAENTSFPEIIW